MNNSMINTAIPVLLSVFLFHGIAHAQCPFTAIDASDGTVADTFGEAVAISGDTIVVGAPAADTAVTNEGAAYVYVLSGSTWIEQGILTADDGADVSEFGRAVAIDGDIIVVGAGNTAVFGNGAAYVFERSGSTWTKIATLEPDPIVSEPDGDFGNAVAIDGDTIVVGAHLDGQVIDAVPVSTAGAAYVFTNGGVWTDATSAVKLGAEDVESQDHFGWSVDVDGDRIVVGATDNGDGVGTAYVFDGPWTATTTASATLLADDGVIGDGFGEDVAVSGDTVLVGAPLDDNANGADKGAAYVFAKDGSWSQQDKLLSNNTQVSAGEFGTAVDLVGDTAVVCEPNVQHLYSAFVAVIHGSAHLFERSGTSWSHMHELLAYDHDAFEFPTSGVQDIAFSGGNLAFGSPDPTTEAGSAFAFTGLDDDCNDNGVPDACDITIGTSDDVDDDGIPDECPSTCAADLDGDDGVVNVFDLLELLGAWGTDGPGATLAEPLDTVNVFDLLELLSAWGSCP